MQIKWKTTGFIEDVFGIYWDNGKPIFITLSTDYPALHLQSLENKSGLIDQQIEVIDYSLPFHFKFNESCNFILHWALFDLNFYEILLFQEEPRDVIDAAYDKFIEIITAEGWTDPNLPPPPLECMTKVLLTQDLPEYNLSKGTKGLIIDVYQNDGNLSYEVEFTDESEQVLAQLEVKKDYLKKVT
jgi:hypothetical protein